MKKLKWCPKRIALILLVLITLAWGLSFGVRLYRFYRLPECNVEITGTIVDNCYNNVISEFNVVNNAGDLVRIDDKLYFNYYGNYATYGLYEITSNAARRIYWDGHGPEAFITGEGGKLYPIQVYNGKLLMNTIVDRNYCTYYIYNKEIKEWELAQGSMLTYCEETQTFEASSLFGDGVGIHALTYQETPFGLVYESSDRYDLWVYTQEGGSEQIVSEDVRAFYAVAEQIYYLTRNTANNSFVLRVFDWASKTDAEICEWTEYSSLPYFIIEEDILIFSATHREKNTESVYTMNLSDPERRVEVLYTIDKNDPNADYIYSWNVWNGTVYLCTKKGLIACDLDTGTNRMLCEKKILECDIVDDTWIYFLESDSHYLWRVLQSGGEAELVLG